MYEVAEISAFYIISKKNKIYKKMFENFLKKVLTKQKFGYKMLTTKANNDL